MKEEITFIDILKVIIKRRKAILTVAFLITTLSLLYSLTLKKVYKAEATILLSTSKDKGFGSLPIAITGPDLGKSGQIMAILSSRTLTERMINKYDLAKLLYPTSPETGQASAPLMEDIIKNVKGMISFEENKKNQTIVFSVISLDPKIAADLVNKYIEELEIFINENTFTSSKKNRIFIERQLERNKTELLESGREINSFYTSNKISNIDSTLDVEIPQGPHDGSNDEDILRSDLGEIGPLQKKSEDLKSKIIQAKTVKKIPQQVYLQYLTLQREVLGQINSLLAQQYEMAKINEAKDNIDFSVIDWARVPERKFKPHRAKIVVISFIISILIGVFYAFLLEYLNHCRLEVDRLSQ